MKEMGYVDTKPKGMITVYKGIEDNPKDSRVLVVDEDGWSRHGGKELIWMLVAYYNGNDETSVGICLPWLELKRLSDDLKRITDKWIECGIEKDEKHINND